MSNIRGITRENGVRNKEDDLTNISDGRHVEFGKQVSMNIDPNDTNNIRNECYILKSLTLEV